MNHSMIIPIQEVFYEQLNYELLQESEAYGVSSKCNKTRP